MLSFDNAAVANRVVWIKETHPDAKMRDAAQEAIKKFEDWSVGTDYREDVYRVLQAFADTKPAGDEEDGRLIHDILLGYKRAGLALPPEQRTKVEALRKELAAVGTDFDSNIAKATTPVKFTLAELEGVADAFATCSTRLNRALLGFLKDGPQAKV